MNNHTQIEQTAEARYCAYMVLQSIFGTEPTADQYDVLKDPAIRAAFETAGSTPTCAKAQERFFSFLEDNEFSHETAAEYTRLFIGPSTLPAPPWESVYVNNEPLLLVESTIEVRKAYLAQGYAPKLFPNVADDHISLELDFMKRLSLSSCEALAGEDESTALGYLQASKAFLENHLARWIGRFCAELASNTEGYYERAADLAAAFVQADLDTIDLMLEAIG